MTRIDAFKKVVLNFEKVKVVGQAFTDEVLRAFSTKYQ